MSNPKKTHDLIRQNEKIVKKPQKHDANLQKNTTLYFQIGLIVCLLMVYSLFEMKFKVNLDDPMAYVDPDDFNEEVAIDNVKVYEKPEMTSAPEQIEKKVLLINEPKIVDDIFKGDIPDVITSEENVSTDTPLNPDAINVSDNPGEEAYVPFEFIEQVPIYPGCEKKKTNATRRKCMSDKISSLIKRKFDQDLGAELGLSGRQVIQTQFKINKSGHVVDVKTRAPHTKLEKEAVRVINKIPEMTPGKQRDKNVSVIYNLPIVFWVDN